MTESSGSPTSALYGFPGPGDQSGDIQPLGETLQSTGRRGAAVGTARGRRETIEREAAPALVLERPPLHAVGVSGAVDSPRRGVIRRKTEATQTLPRGLSSREYQKQTH